MADKSLITQEQMQSDLEQFYSQKIYPYLNGATHAGFTPVGSVIAIMGNEAPNHYLACDGTLYTIADYPQLTAYFEDQFGSVNFFGGNGTTTFAVPDLRGEFLRGSGTNSHTNQGSGSNVGVHQNATESMTLVNWGAYYLTELKDPYATDDLNNSTKNIDTMIADGNVRNYLELPAGSFRTQSDATNRARYTSRPTNTSVLYCIAYKNIYIDLALDSFPLGISNPTDGQLLMYDATAGRWVNGGGVMHEYSTDERVVATWVDGKPIYEKTIINAILPSVSNWALLDDSVSYDKLFKCEYCMNSNFNGYWMPNNEQNVPRFSIQQSGNLQNKLCYYATSNITVCLVIRYTKTTDTV